MHIQPLESLTVVAFALCTSGISLGPSTITPANATSQEGGAGMLGSDNSGAGAPGLCCDPGARFGGAGGMGGGGMRGGGASGAVHHDEVDDVANDSCGNNPVHSELASGGMKEAREAPSTFSGSAVLPKGGQAKGCPKRDAAAATFHGGIG
eukprot:1914307-Amphidinium_carterae.1